MSWGPQTDSRHEKHQHNTGSDLLLGQLRKYILLPGPFCKITAITNRHSGWHGLRASVSLTVGCRQLSVPSVCAHLSVGLFVRRLNLLALIVAAGRQKHEDHIFVRTCDRGPRKSRRRELHVNTCSFVPHKNKNMFVFLRIWELTRRNNLPNKELTPSSWRASLKRIAIDSWWKPARKRPAWTNRREISDPFVLWGIIRWTGSG